MTDAVEPMNLTVAPATAARRTGPWLWRIGAVVLASLLLVAMVVFLVTARADRDDAEAARREAAAHLRDARNRADDAEELRTMAVTRSRCRSTSS
jgi:type VI protein secretion system component VasK